MAKASFLGIKRVEALLKIVDEKRKDALNSIGKIPDSVTELEKIDDVTRYYHSKGVDIAKELLDFKAAADKLLALGFEDYSIRNASKVEFQTLYSYIPD